MLWEGYEEAEERFPEAETPEIRISTKAGEAAPPSRTET